MRGRKIWLINFASMPPNLEVRIQTQKKAQYLMELGWDVTIIGGSYVHNTDVNLIKDKRSYIEAEYDGLKFIHIRNTSYKSNGIKRIYSLLEFYIRLWWVSKKFLKPDFIEQIAAVPFSNIAYFIAKRFKSFFIVNVVDLWPESFVAYGLVSKNNWILKLAYTAERWLYKKADLLIFSMEGGKDYIQEKGWHNDVNLDKIYYLNNGVDLKDFDYNKDQYQLDDVDLLDEQNFKVVYLGSIRKANNVKAIIEAAQHLSNQKDIKFLIYGDGDERTELENFCSKNKINNVIFKEKWIELKYVPFILSKSSLNVLNYQPSPILRFGGSQSKSFQYMASGKPICSNVEMNYCPITNFNIGVSKKFDSSQAYAEAILKFYNMEKQEYDKLCENARSASVHYDYKNLTLKYHQLLLDYVQ